MQRFETTTPEGVDLVLWGDLRIIFEEHADDDLWKNQEKWMLKKRRYPLTKETLERMMALRLIAETESEAVINAPCYGNEALAIPEQTATVSVVGVNKDDPQKALKNKGIVDSGCSRHMTGNKAYLVEYQDYNGGPVAFGGSKGHITYKGKIRTGKLDFEDVFFVKELQQFNLFSVLQMCDKNNKFLFTNTECLVLSPDFKLPDENQREYSNARTPQPNGVAERNNRALIE
ncbi:hypothetical protein Tco_1360230, partial [Tanacetum coccineum]